MAVNTDVVTEAGGQVIGAVGDLVAALLQTAGLYGQAKVLHIFTPVLVEIGAFVYIIACIGALISFAVFGNYKKALYLFIGPTLFIFMLTTTEDVSPVELRFGDRIAEKAEYQSMIEKFIDPKNIVEDAKISSVFAFYDGVVSEVVQKVVGVLIDTENGQDLLNAARERTFAQVFKVESTDQELTRLISLASTAGCAELSNTRIELYSIGKKKPFTEADRIHRDALIKQRDSLQRNVVVNLEERVVNYLKKMDIVVDRTDVTCDKLWEYVALRSLEEAESRINELAEREEIDSGKREGNNGYNVPRAKVIEELQKSIEGDNPQTGRAAQIVAAYMIKNTMKKSQHGQLSKQINSHMPFERNKFNFAAEKMPGHLAVGKYTKLAYYAGTLPYIQGMLLMLLSVAFPFFTVLLILPGRARSFFIWAGLWVWVKSWDIGFAVVYNIREILWLFVRKQSQAAITAQGETAQFTESVGGQFDWTSMDSVFFLMAENDPLASYALYFNLVAILTLAVPLFTAHLFLGGTGLFEGFKSHIDKSAQRFDQQAGNESRNSSTGARTAEHSVLQDEAAAKSGEKEWDKQQSTQNKAADGKVPRAADAAKGVGDYKTHFGDKAAHIRAGIFGAQSRLSSNSSGRGNQLLTAALNKHIDENHAGNVGSENLEVSDSRKASKSRTKAWAPSSDGINNVPIAGQGGD